MSGNRRHAGGMASAMSNLRKIDDRIAAMKPCSRGNDECPADCCTQSTAPCFCGDGVAHARARPCPDCNGAVCPVCEHMHAKAHLSSSEALRQ
jgi:hypothetical protein